MLYGACTDIDIYHVVRMPHLLKLAEQIRFIGLAYHQRCIGIRLIRQLEVTVHYDIAVIIGKQHRDIGVSFYYRKQEIDICPLAVTAGYLFCGIGPYLHSGAFLSRQIVDQQIRRIQKHRHHHSRYS